MRALVALLVLTVWICKADNTDDPFLFKTFPDGFKWGAGSTAYKVEGGATADGKGVSVWDVWTHQAGKDQSGDIAADSYHKFKDDVKLLKDLKVKIYRFSISWSRIMPTGRSPINQPGIDYYKNLIQELTNNDIEPVVVLLDDDTPEELQRLGGWLNPETVSYFREYARICFSNFGTQVKTWITINNIDVTAVDNYGYGKGAPGIWEPGTNPYTVHHNLLNAHTAAYRLYVNDFRTAQQGQIGIGIQSYWHEPKYPNHQVDKDAQKRSLEWNYGWTLNPLIDGDYSNYLKQIVQQKSDPAPSRLPTFTLAEINNNRGAVDFISINYEGTVIVTSKIKNCNPAKIDCDFDVEGESDKSYMGHPAPNGLRKLLKWVKDEYNNKPVYVNSEMSDMDDTKEDHKRVMHVKLHINQLLKAVDIDKCNVNGYIYNALLDGFEFTKGYGSKTGLYHVNFLHDAERQKTPRASSLLYRQIITDNGFNAGYPGYAGMATGVVPYDDGYDMYFDKFPDDFVWGVATQAYCVEGGWNADNKGPSVWDTSSLSEEHGGTGDVGSNQYYHYKGDVQLIKKLGVKLYSFSISWSRIFPDGTAASYNAKGMEYYQNLVTELMANGITPMATLYYWDLPQALEDKGGWLDDSIVDHFRDYADKCFESLGDKVKLWITINDPQSPAVHAYGYGRKAPYRSDSPGTYPYIYAKNTLLAHAKAYRLYESNYKVSQQGKVGFSPNFHWMYPKTPLKVSDLDAVDRFLQFFSAWWLDPIYGNGDYPELLKEIVARKSNSTSRLVPLSTEEQALIKGSSDFLGVSFYSALLGEDFKYPITSAPDVRFDHDVKVSFDPSWLGVNDPKLGNVVNRVTPQGMRKILNWVKYKYNNPPVYITENGYADLNGSLADEHRIHFYRTYTNNVLKAIQLDGCNVKGYIADSLLDGFEWEYGYGNKLGFYSVDFKDPNRNRTARGSAHWYSILTSENAFNRGYTQKGGWGVAPQYTDQFYYDKFPDDFVFSTATSSAQIEGAWNIDGKGPSIWDTFANAGKCKENATPQIACDSYHKYKEDVAILKNLGVRSYRFSIAWSRVMSDGTPSSRNQKGIDYYNNVINELLANKINPVVTIFHWDLPQGLEDHGGWLNSSIAERFREYSDLLFREFGDRVNMWITLNEPWVFTVLGYGAGTFAPGIDKIGFNEYIAAHNAIKAHAESYHQYHDVYKGKGRIGITLNIDWVEPFDKFNMADLEASENGVQTFLGWFAHPIYVNGDYPPVMKAIIARHSKDQKLDKSRLPEFTEEEKQRINGTSDFFGMNSYTSGIAKEYDPVVVGKGEPMYWTDRGANINPDPKWKRSGSSWLYVVPWGIRKILNWVRNHYNIKDILITENGVSDNNSTLDDFSRVYFFTHYINEVLKAVKLDGVNVIGYTAWSVLDNFEWQSGYTEYFGLYSVNFSDPNRPRKPKRSAQLIHNIIQDRGFIKGSKTDPHRTQHLPKENEFIMESFPKLFGWGGTTTAYGTEGAWNADGKGPSALDVFYHKDPSKPNGDVAADSYNKYMDDIEVLKNMSATSYFSSISWSRVLPDGVNINQVGVNYYKKLFKTLRQHKIDPVVSLFNWDLPDILETRYGGWLNASTIDLFEQYARTCFKQFGYQVTYWVTMQEPQHTAFWAYEGGELPPAKTGQTADMYTAVHNMIKAHARVYHMYHKEFARLQKGSVGITLRRDWYLPNDFRNPADNDATWRNIEFDYGWVADPLLKTGDYPDIMKKLVTDSRLPIFTQAEKEENKGAVDYIGLSHYSTFMVSQNTARSNPPSFVQDKGVNVYPNKEYLSSGSNHLMVYPKGIRMMLRTMKEKYGNIPMFIAGNGISDKNAQANKISRRDYIMKYTNEVLKAVVVDEVPVYGYTYFPLIDSFNGKSGYSDPSGLFSLDSNKKRKHTEASDFLGWLAGNNGYKMDDDHQTTMATPKPTEPTKTVCKPPPTSISTKPHGSSSFLLICFILYFLQTRLF